MLVVSGRSGSGMAWGEAQAAGEGHRRVATGTQQARGGGGGGGKGSKMENAGRRAGALAGQASHHVFACSSRLGRLIMLRNGEHGGRMMAGCAGQLGSGVHCRLTTRLGGGGSSTQSVQRTSRRRRASTPQAATGVGAAAAEVAMPACPVSRAAARSAIITVGAAVWPPAIQERRGEGRTPGGWGAQKEARGIAPTASRWNALARQSRKAPALAARGCRSRRSRCVWAGRLWQGVGLRRGCAARDAAPGMIGMTEASTTRSPSTPWTRRLASTTLLPSAAPICGGRG